MAGFKHSMLVRVFFLLVVLVTTLLGIAPSLCWAIVVTNTNNSGPGSLRQAILDARSDSAANVITFDPPVFRDPINLLTVLPSLTGPGDTIDGAGKVTLNGAKITTDTNAIPCSDSQAQCHGIRIFARDITILGLRVQNFGGDGIRVQPNPAAPSGSSGQILTGIVISNSIITKNGRHGIRVLGGEDTNQLGVTITGNDVSNNDDSGIVVSGSNNTGSGGNSIDVTISANTIRASAGKLSDLSGDGIGIVGGGGTGTTGDNAIQAIISDNIIQSNAGEGIRVTGAGTGSSSSNNTIDATITGNRTEKSGVGPTGSGNGITITGGPTPTVPATTSGNTVTFLADSNVSINNRDNGIGVQGGNGSSHVVSGTILNNTFNNNNLAGIFLTGRGSSTTTVLNIEIQLNTVKDNSREGLLIFGGDVVNTVNATISNVLVDDNIFVGNKLNGISTILGTGPGNVISFAGITNNLTSSNGGDGLFIPAGVNGSGPTPISGNDADKNKQDGMDIRGLGYFLSENSADKNTAAGISAVGNGHDFSNTAKGNASCNTPGCF